MLSAAELSELRGWLEFATVASRVRSLRGHQSAVTCAQPYGMRSAGAFGAHGIGHADGSARMAGVGAQSIGSPGVAGVSPAALARLSPAQDGQTWSPGIRAEKLWLAAPSAQRFVSCDRDGVMRLWSVPARLPVQSAARGRGSFHGCGGYGGGMGVHTAAQSDFFMGHGAGDSAENTVGESGAAAAARDAVASMRSRGQLPPSARDKKVAYGQGVRKSARRQQAHQVKK